MVAAIAAPAPQPDARATGDCPAPVVLRFELASAALNLAAARGDLAPLADWLAKHPESRVVVQGHADARGGDQDNLALSFRRATVVAGLLQELGVPSRRALVQAAGDHEPVEGLAPLADENRRVVVAPRDAAGCPRSR
jgi:outer membrane protein OmpA-like peptidoglycan-associated protein